MAKKITFALNTTSINAALRELQKQKNWIEEKSNLLAEKLASIGEKVASIRFSGAYYETEKDVEISVAPIENGWKVVASGEDVCFIEFGAGVYYNGAEPHPNRPKEISRIGEYGHGKGKQSSWGYKNDSGELVITHGTPAAMPMHHATVEMQRELTRIAREVFR